MSHLRSAAKLVGAQALGLFIVFNIVIWTICLGFSIARLVGPGLQPPGLGKAARMAALPNYAGVDWARTHFQEFAALSSRYVSYIGWRREPFQGKTITLTGPYAQRATVGTADSAKPSVYFFGGSTMWGTGADDANTIPSLVTQIGGYRSVNYGESAYTAHQSLVLLIQLLQEGHRPNVVVFYDGANDVAHKCRSELTPTSHAREGQIRSALAATKGENVYGLRYMAEPMLALAGVISSRIALLTRSWRSRSEEHFACHSNRARAQQIADNLIGDWDVARRLVESYGGKFIGMLQPVSYGSDTKLEHLQLSDVERRQFQAVYPLIRARMHDRPGLYDITGVLDRNEYLYVDFCHLSPNGNRHVAQRVVEVLADVKE
jgi:hypothetical protein